MIIRAQFPSGVFYGDDSPVPHPARLFSAMVAAYHDGRGGESERDALLAIESSPAPEITAPNIKRRRVGTHFVRVNSKSHDLKGRKFPAMTADGPVDYHFTTTADPNVINDLLERIPYLGTTSSNCQLTVVQKSGEPNLFPGGKSDSKKAMRVPYRGFLNQLERAFEKNTASLDRKGVRMHAPRVRRILYSNKGELPTVSGEFNQLIPIAIKGRSLAGTRGPEIARAFRRALMSVLDNPIASVVSGHSPDGTPVKESHIGFHPMLFSGTKHADGHVMGVALLLPSRLKQTERFVLLKGLKNIESLRTPWAEFEVSQFDPAWSLNSLRYTDSSRVWSTVTPLELPCYPRKKKGAHEIVAECVEASGLPKPASVRVSSNPRLSGGYESKMYEKKRGMLIHADITFDQPVSGPIAIGRGRYLGHGLCVNRGPV